MQSLDSNTTGTDNVALGYNTLGVNTTGANNVAVGSSALGNNITSNNTAVGYNAGGSITTGRYGVYLGDNAASGLTTGYGNVMIGFLTTPYASNSNYNIVIGYSCKGVNVGGYDDDYTVTMGIGTGSDRIYNMVDVNASWTRVSDVRYKEEIQDNTDCGLAFINDLRPVTYKWKPKANIDSSLPDYNPEETERRHDAKMYGLIAQEVKEALDTHNITDFGGWNEIDAGTQTISQEMFVHPLIKAVQELSAKNDALEARIAALEG
jgi:hypothetical protein